MATEVTESSWNIGIIIFNGADLFLPAGLPLPYKELGVGSQWNQECPKEKKKQRMLSVSEASGQNSVLYISQYCGYIILKYLAGDWDLLHGFGKVGEISERCIASVNSPYHLQQ